jgi:hypothetical protein
MTVPHIVTDTSEPSKRTLANRRNALKSTGRSARGPESTAAGKHRVAMNAFKHGLSGQNLCLQADESIPYFDLALRFIEDLQPVGVREEQLAQKIIDGNWRLNRAAAMENNLLNNDTVVETYRLTSDDPRSAAIAGQGNAWRADCAGARALESLGRHEARIARTLFKTTAEFDMLQARRLKRNNDEDTFVAKQSRAWIFLSNALNHYRAIEKEKEAQQQEELEAEVEEPEQEETPQPNPNKPTYKMALNWQDDPIPEFYPSEPSRESMNRNQALRDFAASIGQPFPVFTDDGSEQSPE